MFFIGICWLGTPSLRDIIFHTQWCAALAMVAVQWPGFICTLASLPHVQSARSHNCLDPILSQTAWSMLTYSTYGTVEINLTIYN